MIRDLLLCMPEFVLLGTVLIVILVDLLARENRSQATLFSALIGVVGSVLAVSYSAHLESGAYFSGMLQMDAFTTFCRLFFLLVVSLTLAYGYKSSEIEPNKKGEFYFLVLSVTLGMMLLVAANNLLMLYLSLELVSILSFVLAGFQVHNRLSNEAALKYTIFGAAASGLMLYGISLLYGFAGSLDFMELRNIFLATLQGGTEQRLLIFLTILLLFSGFAFKMSVFPMHMWSPDVYEGSPTPSAAFFTVAPKAAGFAAFIRFFFTVLVEPKEGGWTLLAQGDWALILAVISALTMTIGNLAALKQQSAKRLLAYSSIAHAGYMLMGLAVFSLDGLKAVLFYFIVYYLMNFGAFMLVGIVGEAAGGEEVSRFDGLGKTAPFLAITLTFFLFSLTGLPVFAGFLGKLYLFAAVVKGEIYWLAVVGVINSAISFYYYARIVKAMFFVKEAKTPVFVPLSLLQKAMILILALPTTFMLIYWEPVISFASRSLLPFLHR